MVMKQFLTGKVDGRVAAVVNNLAIHFLSVGPAEETNGSKKRLPRFESDFCKRQ